MNAKTIMTDTIALEKLMIEKGYRTNKSLADASGIDRTTLGKVLSGLIQPSTDVMYKLVVTLEMSKEQAGCIFFAHVLHDAQDSSCT